MRRILAMFLVLGLLASPAMAWFGIWNEDTQGLDRTLNIDEPIGTLTWVTFGWHNDLGYTVEKLDRLHFNFICDFEEVAVRGFEQVAPFEGPWTNYTPATMATWLTAVGLNSKTASPYMYAISSFGIGVGTPLATGTISIATSATVKLFKLEVSVHARVENMYYDLYMGHSAYPENFMCWTSDYSTWTTVAATGHGGISVAPEPGSMTLLIAGIAGIGGGIWRRRR